MGLRAGFIRLAGLSMLLVALFGYQNCAQQVSSSVPLNPATVSEKAIPPFTDPVDGTVSIGDQTENNNSLALSFVESQKTIPLSENQIRVDGICSSQQNGSILYFSLNDQNQNLVYEGFSRCELSGFVVLIALQSPLNCASTYHLEAQLGLAKKAEMLITADCSSN